MLAKTSLRNSFRAARLAAVGFASFVAVVLMTSLPLHADIYWSNTASGDWSNAGDWSGNLLPTSSDNAWIVNGGTATVTTMGDTCGTLSLGSSAGSGTVPMTAGSIYAYVENIGYSGLGAFTQSGGTHSVSEYFYLGVNAGVSGTYSLSGSGLLSVPYECIGTYGTGSFTQSGGTHSVFGNLYLGYSAGSSGAYSLSGSGLLSAAEGDEYIGYSGTGSFTQSGGTHSSVSEAVYLGYGGSGTYSLSGSGLLSVPVEVIGDNGTGRFAQSGGTNSVSRDLYLAKQRLRHRDVQPQRQRSAFRTE